MYSAMSPDVYFADQRLQIVAALVDRDDETSAADVVRAFGVSVPQAYKLAAQARQALHRRPPGPRPAVEFSWISPQLAALPRPERAAWDRRGAILEAAVSNVSIRGQKRLFVAFGEAAPSSDFLVDTLARAGRAARRLMARANDQVRDRLVTAAGDDIFFHRVAVKVLIEPVSGAVLDLMRWPWREAEDWALWIRQWPALRLFVSDLGTDLVGAVPLVNAARDVPIAHQGDHFHESAWWTEIDQPWDTSSGEIYVLDEHLDLCMSPLAGRDARVTLPPDLAGRSVRWCGRSGRGVRSSTERSAGEASACVAPFEARAAA